MGVPLYPKKMLLFFWSGNDIESLDIHDIETDQANAKAPCYKKAPGKQIEYVISRMGIVPVRLLFYRRVEGRKYILLDKVSGKT